MCVVKFIENNEVYINFTAFILTFLSTILSVISWYCSRENKKEVLKAKEEVSKAKKEVCEKLDYIDFHAFISKLYDLIDYLSKTVNIDNNNRGEKLNKNLDDISGLMVEMLNMLKFLPEQDVDEIKEKSENVKDYIMQNKTERQIDVVFLRKKLEEIYFIFNSIFQKGKGEKI